MITQLSDEKSELLLSQNKRDQTTFSYGFWMSSPPTYKNSQIVWER